MALCLQMMWQFLHSVTVAFDKLFRIQFCVFTTWHNVTMVLKMLATVLVI